MTQRVAVCLEQYKIMYMTETIIRNSAYQPLLCVGSMLKFSVLFVKKKKKAAAAPRRWCYRAAVSDSHDGWHEGCSTAGSVSASFPADGGEGPRPRGLASVSASHSISFIQPLEQAPGANRKMSV